MAAENSRGTATRGRPFTKGQSGNPGGRPAVVSKIKLQLIRKCPKHLRELEKLAADPKTPVDTRARIRIWFAERVLGRAAQELTGPDGMPLIPDARMGMGDVDLARRVAFIFTRADQALRTQANNPENTR